jgi:hypothetical protein
MRNQRFHGGEARGGMMILKAKDVVRDALLWIAAASPNSRLPCSPTLPSHLVPHAASLARLRYRVELKNLDGCLSNRCQNYSAMERLTGGTSWEY